MCVCLKREGGRERVWSCVCRWEGRSKEERERERERERGEGGKKRNVLYKTTAAVGGMPFPSWGG